MLEQLDNRSLLYLATPAFVFASVNWCRKHWENRSRRPLPPGPPCLPILGSILSLDDPARPWLGFNAWKSTYGDIIYVRLLTKSILVVNSEKVARDLFELRSVIYSDRPQSIVYEPFALDFNTGLLPYGDKWRLHRRIFHQQFHRAAIHTYHAELLRGAHQMLFNFLQDPTNYTGHVRMFTSSFILSVVYDYQPTSENDHVVHIMRKFMKLVVTAVGPGATVVIETFPFLLQLPVWFPGAIFKRASVECLQVGHDTKEIPFQCYNGLTQNHNQSNGQMPQCLVADTMNRMRGFENEVIEAAIKEAACISFAAASETTFGTIFVFLLAMILHPEVQAKAQADIDRAVGKDRLPDFNDRPALPYVEAVLRETLRWHPLFPMGIPHATTTSDIYKGYFIPKGVIVIANTWAMTRDEQKYPNPDEFKPERFLHEDGSLTSDTMSLAFGWGRRMCVGQHLGDAALWIAITSFLATFSVHKAFDESGEEIPVVPKFPASIISPPETFPCQIVPRFKDASVERLTQLTGLGPSEFINMNFDPNADIVAEQS
ncbi:cytochrome P450 [Rhizopogon vinicolor AM-OR11-026]|uniref:Cytochrome P450 n=1 Tax=Rhizopogon vinicolor AM-OR11-026 TaxID=1314800 RepID=A0A1B7MMI5_9AGAM|nr:cytochrome P450 [Rhizopogon vinicolor AM-OR11-026]